jgi:hypothetical protein
MNRREFIAGVGSAAAWPLVARAQQSEPMRRVAFLAYGGDTDIGFGALSFRRLLGDSLVRLSHKEGI